MPATLTQAFGFLLGVLLAIVLLTPLGARGDELRGGLSADVSGLPQLEAALFRTVNDWRGGRHLTELVRLPELDAVARGHSADMASRGYFAHETPEGANPVDRIHAGGVAGFSLAAENVGMTNRSNPNGEVFGGWLQSKDHFENLRAPSWNATGLGIARRADGTLFYTQVYVTFPR